MGAKSGSARVQRGGGWNNDAGNCRSANRDKGPPSSRDCSVGFRIVLPDLAGLDKTKAEKRVKEISVEKHTDSIIITAYNTNETLPKEKFLQGYFVQDLFCGIPGTYSYDFKMEKGGMFYLHAYFASDETRPATLFINNNDSGLILSEVTGGWNTEQLKWFVYGPYKFKSGKNTIALKFPSIPSVRGFYISPSKETPSHVEFPKNKYK